MRLTIKRLIIILLSVAALSFIKTKTASAYPDQHAEGIVAVNPPQLKEDDLSKDDQQYAGTPVAQNSPVPLSTIITSTPDEDGIIIHTVQYGETLFTIAEAYGVPIDQILTNSGLSLTTTELREGQVLVIQTATEPTATPSPTATIDPGTPTPTQVRPTFTPFPTRTPAPTTTPTRPPSIVHRALGNTKYFGIGLILISVLGLIFVIYWGFLKKS